MKRDSSQNLQNLLIIGLTGGIGSGKSTVAHLLSHMGALCINADKIAHNLMETKEIKEQLRNVFGSKIFDSSEHLNRSALANLVFQRKDGIELKKLTDVLHPAVREEIHKQLLKWNHSMGESGSDKFKKKAKRKMVILDVPLLLESPLKKLCSSILFIDTPYQQRLERIRTTRGWSEEELLEREHFQISLEEKQTLSDYCIKNQGNLEELKKAVQDIWIKIFPQNSI